VRTRPGSEPRRGEKAQLERVVVIPPASSELRWAMRGCPERERNWQVGGEDERGTESMCWLVAKLLVSFTVVFQVLSHGTPYLAKPVARF